MSMSYVYLLINLPFSKHLSSLSTTIPRLFLLWPSIRGGAAPQSLDLAPDSDMAESGAACGWTLSAGELSGFFCEGSGFSNS